MYVMHANLIHNNSFISFFSIVTVIDAKHISRYIEILVHMKTIGNQIIAIGLEDDWEILLALASIGFDRRKNLYLFNTTQFNKVIDELHSE